MTRQYPAEVGERVTLLSGGWKGMTGTVLRRSRMPWTYVVVLDRPVMQPFTRRLMERVRVTQRDMLPVFWERTKYRQGRG